MGNQGEQDQLSVLVHDMQYSPSIEGTLNLSNLGLRTFDEIEGLARIGKYIKILNLGQNEIEIIGDLSYLVRLKQLELSDNKITRMEGLIIPSELEELSLRNNRIEKISALKSSKKLKVLLLSGNRLQDIRGLESSHELETLWLNEKGRHGRVGWPVSRLGCSPTHHVKNLRLKGGLLRIGRGAGDVTDNRGWRLQSSFARAARTGASSDSFGAPFRILSSHR
jgi:hypothetical protein